MNREALSRSLTESLHLSHPPIAVAVVDAVPAGVPSYDGTVPAGCRFWQEAARAPFATATRDHELCSIGVHTHQLAGASPQAQAELGAVLGVMANLDYVRPEDVAAIPVMPRASRHVVYAPLAQAPVDPDVVLLFLHARQGLVMTEAAQQVDGAVPPALGRPACAIIPQAITSGRAALSLGCCGARAYLDVMSDDVALWALPAPRLAAYADRLAVLARANDLLAGFHARRRQDVAAGERPTLEQSLARIG
jgi:uncharacterized protein (DUF169 family)